MRMLFTGGSVFNGSEMLRGHAVMVENAKVKAVGPAETFRGHEGARVDTSGGTLMPGLIDCHVHLVSGAEADSAAASLRETPAMMTLSTLERAQATLAGGTVAVRDCGGKDYIELAVRDAVGRGAFEGPKIHACGRPLCMTGGHGASIARVADGRDEVVKAVREQIHAGADFIKIMATGGVMTPGVDPEDSHYLPEEIEAAVREAARFRKTTASHAQGTGGILNATLAGITSIEHGIFMDQRCIDAMLEHNTYLVPTLAAVRNIANNKDANIPPWAIEKALRVLERHLQSFRDFYAAGGKIALGTDAGTPFNKHGENAMELEYMVEAGMSPLDALIAGTKNAADLCRFPDHGRISEGATADFLLVNGDPTQDIRNAARRENHHRVFKSGHAVRKPGEVLDAGKLAPMTVN